MFSWYSKYSANKLMDGFITKSASCYNSKTRFKIEKKSNDIFIIDSYKLLRA